MRKQLAGILAGVSMGMNAFLPFFGSQPLPTPVHQSQLSWYEVLHHPVIDGKQYTATAYMTLPFRRADVKNYNIYQGFIYSADELKIHKGNPVHGAVDFELPYGAPVVAPADGYAMSSYLSSWVEDEQTKEPKQYKGKPIRLGFGYFVRMYIPSVDRYLDLAHLSDVDQVVPFSPPEKTEEGWEPTNYKLKREEWTNSPYTVFVKKGTVIGKVGYSGLGWGSDADYQEGATRPIVVDPNVFKSWDKPHIHFEEFGINQENGLKGWQRDPYGIYDTFDFYPTPDRKAPTVREPLFFVGSNNLPKYADDL